MDSPNLDLNDDAVLQAVSDAFTEANEILGRQAQQEITANKWAWPNPPSPRDIVDHGQLRSSYGGDREGDSYAHTWATGYATAVKEGYVTRSGSTMPGRDWTKEPLGRFDETFGAEANAKLRSVK